MFRMFYVGNMKLGVNDDEINSKLFEARTVARRHISAAVAITLGIGCAYSDLIRFTASTADSRDPKAVSLK